MKACPFCCVTLLLLVARTAPGQGTLLFDQQSSTLEGRASGTVNNIQGLSPFGQSFVPALSEVGFIRLYLSDLTPGGTGATVAVNLRADSITGALLGSSEPVFIPAWFLGYTNLFFATPVSVTPLTTYYFQIAVKAGDPLGTRILVGDLDYPVGTVFLQGAARPLWDLWFREGIVIPEPASWLLLLAGCGILTRRRRTESPAPTNAGAA